MDFNSLDIKVTGQIENGTWDPMIRFTIGNYSFLLSTKKSDKTGKLFAQYVDHVGPVDSHDHYVKNLCPVCYSPQNRGICRPLHDVKKSLFLHLIEQPPIRLDWLFKDYEQKKEPTTRKRRR